MRNPLRGLFQTKSIGIHRIEGLSGFEHLTDVNNLNSYKDSLYLYIGVSMIMKRVAGIPLELYKIKNRKGDVTEVFDHPLLDVLSNPNSFQSAREFWELSVSHYLLSGDCFWLLERNGTKIEQMVVLRPDYVEVALSADGKTIVGYDYRHHTVQRFKPEDVLHIRNTDPTNPLRGVGVVRPARSRILTEIEATAYQASFFKNQGRPDFAVFADADVDEEKAADFRMRWKAVFGGKNAGSVGIFGRNVKSVQELNKTPKEMDFIASQHFLRDDILAALRIPKAMVTSDDVNLANAKEAYRVFLQEAVTPVFEAFLDVINTKLVPTVDQSVFFDFTDPAPVDREMLLKETSQLKRDGIITANEARAMYNYDALEGGDALSASPQAIQALAETAKQFIRKRPLLAKKLDAMEKMADLIISSEPKRQLNSIFPDQKSKEAYGKAYNDRIDRKAEVVKEALDTFHEGMLKRILQNELSPTTFMDLIGEKSLAKALFGPIMEKLYKEAGQEALDGLFRKSGEHFFTDAVLLAAIDGRVGFFTNSIVDTTFEVLKAKIADGIKEGHGIEKIGRSLRDYFEDMTVKRARTIAQTETSFVLSKATNDAYQQSAVVTGKEWLTVGDEKVRPEHADNNGKIVPKGATFPNGESHPGDHSVNCRCVLLPAI
ncbi:MAG: phage portal protein [Sphingopyxis sp.]|nr:phage portal protein [Sphingopyxis sp.]